MGTGQCGLSQQGDRRYNFFNINISSLHSTFVHHGNFIRFKPFPKNDVAGLADRVGKGVVFEQGDQICGRHRRRRKNRREPKPPPVTDLEL